MKKTLLIKGIRELWSNRVKYLLLIIILGLGVAMFNSMFAFMASRELTVDAIYEESNFMDYQISFQYGVTKNESYVEELLFESAVRDSITEVEYRRITDVYINNTREDEEILSRGRLIGYNYFYSGGQIREITVNSPLFFAENPTEFISTDEQACFLEIGFADAFGIQPGDILTINKDGRQFDLLVRELINVPDYFIVMTENTIFPNPSNLGVFIVPMQTAQEISQGPTNNEKQINDIIIRIDSTSSLSDIEDILSASFEDNLIPVEVTFREDNPARFQLIEDLEGDQQFIGLFPLIIFSTSAIGLFIALRRMVKTHRPQIGVFKALGVPNQKIFLYFLMIGVIVALSGVALGYVLTFPLNQVFQGLLDQLLKFAFYRQAGSGPYFFLSGIIALLLCLVCTFFPAYTAVKEKPIDIIQTREGLQIKKKKTTKKSLFPRLNLPIPFKIIGRDISRKPMRAFTTIFGVALALSFFLSVVIMADSMLIFMDKAKEANNWDYEISIANFVPVSTRDIWLEEKDVVERVDYTIRLPMNMSNDGINKELLLVGNSDISKTFNVGIDFNEEGGVYISEFLANELNIAKGDWVEVELPVLRGVNDFEMQELEMEVLDVHSNPMGLFVYADISYVYQVTHLDNLANVFYLDSLNRQLPAEVRNTIATTPGVSSVTYVSQQNQNLDEAFELMMSMIFMMILISFVLMLAIVYNITMINASEKSREYATMKTLGTSIRRISYLIFIEGTVTIIGGILLGSIGGYFLAIGMLQSTELLEGFSLDIIFSIQWFLAGAALVGFVVVIVALLTIRYINKIIIADVIRERSAG